MGSCRFHTSESDDEISLDGEGRRREGDGSLHETSPGQTLGIRGHQQRTIISPTRRTPHHCRTQGVIMTRWIPQPSSVLICFLSSLCTGLLIITIILLVTITRQGVDQTEHIMEVKLRNLSLGVQSKVKELSQHDSLMMEKLKAMETFVKDFRKSEVISKVAEIESSMKHILSDEIAGSLSNDHQRILAALGDLAEEIWKGNSTVDPLCDKGWLHHDTSCYYRFPKIQPWMDAKKSCEDKKAHLVVINSREEMDFLRRISRSFTSWIGLKKEHGSWKWVDGTPLEKTPNFWKPGQPDNYVNHYEDEDEFQGEDCANLVDADSWYDTRCSLSFAYICEKILS